MKIYDLVKDVLTKNPQARSKDKELLRAVYDKLGLINVIETHKGYEPIITVENLFRAPAEESITRARRKVQELHPELAATKAVKEKREKKEADKGTFIFREKVRVTPPSFEGGQAKLFS